MRVPTWVEDVGHCLIGLIPGWGVVREIRQWPPSSDRHPPFVRDDGALFFRSERVIDAYRDFAGYAVGDAVRTAILIGLLCWKW